MVESTSDLPASAGFMAVAAALGNGVATGQQREYGRLGQVLDPGTCSGDHWPHPRGCLHGGRSSAPAFQIARPPQARRVAFENAIANLQLVVAQSAAQYTARLGADAVPRRHRLH